MEREHGLCLSRLARRSRRLDVGLLARVRPLGEIQVIDICVTVGTMTPTPTGLCWAARIHKVQK
jgi:hypothetical protein